MSAIDEIYKALRIVPEFDGNPNVLTRFIKLCDQLVQAYVTAEPGRELINLTLLNGILNKVTGPAARLINTNGVPETWDGIRSSLINNFSDQRDETSLYNDLALLTQGSSTPQEYYEKCQTLFATIMTYVSLHETVQNTIDSKRSLYKKLTLQSYLRGLRDPLGSRIRCMRPDTIEKALEFVHDEMNTLYLQQRNEHAPAKKPQPQAPADQTKLLNPVMPHIPMPMQRPFNFNMPGPSRPNIAMPHPLQRLPQMWRPSFNQPQQFQQQGPSRTQQIFGARPFNYNPQNNSSGNNQPKGPSTNDTPKPMSGVSHFVPRPMPFRGNDWSRQGNPPPSNYFRTREMNFNECFEYPYMFEPYCDNNFDGYLYNSFEQPDYSYYDAWNAYMNQQLGSSLEVSQTTAEEKPTEESASSNQGNFQKSRTTNESK